MSTGRLRALAPLMLVSQRVLAGPRGLALLSALMLAGYWAGGEGLLLFAGLAVPAALTLATLLAERGAAIGGRDGVTGLRLRPAAEAELARALAQLPREGRATVCLLFELEGFDGFRRQHGEGVANAVLAQLAARLSGGLREQDLVARLGPALLAAVPLDLRQADTESCIALAGRLLAELSQPVAAGSGRFHVSLSCGFATPAQVSPLAAPALIEAAECALAEARRHGPGTIRAYAPGSRRERVVPDRLHDEIAAALGSGEIEAWFQPQISTDTGQVAGFEALPRWTHPEHGAIAPSEFMPAVLAAGCGDRLARLMLQQSLRALRGWLDAGHAVPAVALALGQAELGDPRLPERIKWELDRWDLPPQRLCLEVVEEVLLNAEDTVAQRNLTALAELGVGIDLEGFGTGSAPLSAIRRFAVDRIRIHRTFVTRVDLDRSQQDMVAAVLSLAERLGLATLAEGVETAGEHAMLAQLGCTAVQGHGLAAPMPFGATLDWMRQHEGRLVQAPQLGRRVV